jgi:hypothetical protein
VITCVEEGAPASIQRASSRADYHAPNVAFFFSNLFGGRITADLFFVCIIHQKEGRVKS